MVGSVSLALGVSDTLFFPAYPTQEGERKGVAVGWMAELMACFLVQDLTSGLRHQGIIDPSAEVSLSQGVGNQGGWILSLVGWRDRAWSDEPCHPLSCPCCWSVSVARGP